MGENIYILPRDMNLNIRSGTVGYNNKILESDGKFNLGKNEKVNSLELTKATIKSHKTVAQLTATQGLPHTDLAQKTTITHEEEKAESILLSNWSFYNMVYVSLNTSLQSLNTAVYFPYPVCVWYKYVR